MIRVFILIVLVISTGYSVAQSFSEGEAKVFNTDEIIFFGYDFSHFKLAEIKRLNDDNQEKFIPAWIGFMNEKRTVESYASQLKKESVIFDFDYTLKVAKNYNGEDMIVMNRQNISKDSIQGIVNNLATTRETGIGFIIIVECFEKINKNASAHYVFFDISTKKVLMLNYYIRNEGDGYGMGNFWGQGLHAITGYYLGDIYRENLKRFLKQKPKKEPSKWEIQP